MPLDRCGAWFAGQMRACATFCRNLALKTGKAKLGIVLMRTYLQSNVHECGKAALGNRAPGRRHKGEAVRPPGIIR